VGYKKSRSNNSWKHTGKDKHNLEQIQTKLLEHDAQWHAVYVFVHAVALVYSAVQKLPPQHNVISMSVITTSARIIYHKLTKYLHGLCIGEVKGRLHWCEETGRDDMLINKLTEPQDTLFCTYNIQTSK